MVAKALKPGLAKLAACLLIGAALALLVSLGRWQEHRAQEKLTLEEIQRMALMAEPVRAEQAQIDLGQLAYRTMHLRGRFVDHALVYIDNRQLDGRPAVQIIQGFKPEGLNFLIPVDRGLLPRDPRAPRDLPVFDQTGSDQTLDIQATILPHFARSMELWGMRVEGSHAIHQNGQGNVPVWSNFNAKAFEGLTGQTVSNFVLSMQAEQSSAPLTLGEQAERHKAYAFQWYAMAGVLALLSCFLLVRQLRKAFQQTPDESKDPQ